MRALAAVVAFMAGPAAALSCMAPDVGATYLRADAEAKAYVVVQGRLIFDENRLPATDWGNQQETPPSTAIPARMIGTSLGAGGFQTPFDRKITLDVLCAGPWCGGARSGASVLAFVARSQVGYTLTIGPCGGDMFTPTPTALGILEQCFNGGPCAAQTDFAE